MNDTQIAKDECRTNEVCWWRMLLVSEFVNLSIVKTGHEPQNVYDWLPFGGFKIVTTGDWPLKKKTDYNTSIFTNIHLIFGVAVAEMNLQHFHGKQTAQVLLNSSLIKRQSTLTCITWSILQTKLKFAVVGEPKVSKHDTLLKTTTVNKNKFPGFMNSPKWLPRFFKK